MLGAVVSQAFTLDELTVAFELRVVHMITTADEEVHPAEVAFLEQVFRADQLSAYGFLDTDDNRFTQRFSRAIEAAPAVLAHELDDDDKLEMMRFFFSACEADGQVDPREMSVVVQAARQIGMDQRALVAHLSRLVGRHVIDRPTIPPKPIPAAPKTHPALATTQDAIHAALGGSPGEGARAVRDQVDALVAGQGDSQLTIVIGAADVRDRLTHGFDALVAFGLRQGRLLDLAGHLNLAFDAWAEDGREPSAIPEVREFLRGLLERYPWLPPFLDPTQGTATNLILSGATFDPETDLWETAWLAALVQAANWAVALTHALGFHQLDYVYEYLAAYEMTDIPPGYFDGVDVLARELDELGRARPA